LVEGRRPSVVTATPRILARLRSPSGATITDLMSATGWQAHSIRGFISGTIVRRHGLAVRSEKAADGTRRYHVEG
jgi:hypothetical protein